MRMVFGLVLIVGVGLAGFAVYMAQGYISHTQAQLAAERAKARPPEPTVTVYVAKKKLEYGDVLGKDDVEAIAWPKRALPKTAFTVLDAKEGAKDADKALFVAGDSGMNTARSVLRPIAQYEPFLTSNITKPGQPAGITSRLTQGMRAFAIRVNETSGVSGFLRPGDRVDVYWTGKGATLPGQQGASDVTRLIEAGVKIIAIDQKAGGEVGPGATIARTVTVEASQEQVAVLAQAQATGRLALSLVGTRDDSQSKPIEVNSSALLGISDTPAPVPVAKKVCTIKQRSGEKVVEVPIPCTN